jgi:hypothetical protein
MAQERRRCRICHRHYEGSFCCCRRRVLRSAMLSRLDIYNILPCFLVSTFTIFSPISLSSSPSFSSSTLFTYLQVSLPVSSPLLPSYFHICSSPLAAILSELTSSSPLLPCRSNKCLSPERRFQLVHLEYVRDLTYLCSGISRVRFQPSSW